MPTATFEPAGQSGSLIPSVLSAMGQGQSLMQRAQQMEQAREQEQRQQDQFEILKPVLQQKALADIASAQGAVASAKLFQQHRLQAATEASVALQDFLEITKIPDVDKRAQALDAHAGRVAWLADLPEYKAFVDSVNEARAKAHIDSIANGKISQAKAATDARSETAEQVIQQRADAAALKATTDIQMQAMKTEMEKLRQEAETLRAEKANATKKDVAATTATAAAQRPANQAAVKANEALLTAGQQAQSGIRDAERGIALLDEVRTGTGAQLQVSAQRLGQLFGVDTSTAKPEELQRILGDAVLKRVNQTKGSISDKEMQLFDSYSASMSKSIEGNKAILTAYANSLRRDVQIAKMVNDLRREGASEREVQLEVNDFVLNHPIFDANAPAPSTGVVIKSVKKIE